MNLKDFNNVEEIFNKQKITERAKEDWGYKCVEARLKCGNKYRHILAKRNEVPNPWSNEFDELSDFQRLMLIKGEMIRTYDSLPNSDKTKIKDKLGLSEFCSKWYRLNSSDKKKLLSIIT